MSLDRSRDLLDEGFELIETRDIAVPHVIFKLDLQVEEERALTLAEQTVLELVKSGVGSPSGVAALMGVDHDVIVRDTIVELLRRGLVSHVEALAITSLGSQSLNDQRTITERTYEDVWLRFDPFHDELLWSFAEGEEIQNGKAVRDMQLHVVPRPEVPDHAMMERRHDEVQKLIDERGIPVVDHASEATAKERELVRMVVRGEFEAWRRAQIEFWYHLERKEMDWRVIYRGGEVRSIRDALQRLMEAGREILPLDSDDINETSAAAGPLTAAVEQARNAEIATGSRLLQGDEHREAMRDAIDSARRELIIVSPWLRTAAVDDELLGWLGRALDRWSELRIIVGYGIERDSGRRSSKDDDQRQALKKLNRLGERKRGRLRTVEIGNTHEKVIIQDRKAAIVTSFNFLSFNPRPGRGIRRETGVRIDDETEVDRLRASLVDSMGLDT